MDSNPNKHSDMKPTKRGSIFLRLSRYVLAQWPLFVPAVIFTLLSNQLSLQIGRAHV